MEDLDVNDEPPPINPKDNHIFFQYTDVDLVKKRLEEMGMGYVTAVVEEYGIKVDQLKFWMLQPLSLWLQNGNEGRDHRKFVQRYYEFLDYFRISDGPIFFKICGESACSGIPNDYLSVLARKFGAAVVTLEHRYYGKSSPFKSLTTENLKYLSSKQALFDLAAFRNFYQESLNVKLNRSNIENPWFLFGTSYSGALSAWFRLKFPHLTCGSLASSAVVQAVYSFSEFDKQVGESAGPECKAALQEITQLVELRLASNRKDLKALFGADELRNDGDFLYFVADAAVTANAYATYVKEYYVKTFGVSVKTYDQENLKSTAGQRLSSPMDHRTPGDMRPNRLLPQRLALAHKLHPEDVFFSSDDLVFIPLRTFLLVLGLIRLYSLTRKSSLRGKHKYQVKHNQNEATFFEGQSSSGLTQQYSESFTYEPEIINKLTYGQPKN
ncbi:hypothetical protein RND71_014174 [Anisodus tanguticus]|uniref:Serine protease EDA2 n=1 Tax=Anisodus tanguticus TaxID=243964 RepID=A0AAE1VMH9_9SOLA|nr:hypothetical protein RND71_014174 [Anisodus tanguticus]